MTDRQKPKYHTLNSRKYKNIHTYNFHQIRTNLVFINVLAFQLLTFHPSICMITFSKFKSTCIDCILGDRTHEPTISITIMVKA